MCVWNGEMDDKTSKESCLGAGYFFENFFIQKSNPSKLSFFFKFSVKKRGLEVKKLFLENVVSTSPSDIIDFLDVFWWVQNHFSWTRRVPDGSWDILWKMKIWTFFRSEISLWPNFEVDFDLSKKMKFFVFDKFFKMKFFTNFNPAKISENPSSLDNRTSLPCHVHMKYAQSLIWRQLLWKMYIFCGSKVPQPVYPLSEGYVKIRFVYHQRFF